MRHAGWVEKENKHWRLRKQGVDFYNHNLGITSPEFYPKIITTRTYQDRLDTLYIARDAGMKICCGGILGMGETRDDRISFLHELTKLPGPLESVPINMLLPIKGTPLENAPPIDKFEFIRTVAVARIILPYSRIRLSAGRVNMSDEMQAWCFMAGANSLFIGEKLLTAPNPDHEDDHALLKKLNLCRVRNIKRKSRKWKVDSRQ